MNTNRLTLYVLFSAALLFCTTTQAHGPTRQKLTEKITIDAPAEEVWAVISNFSTVDTWMPSVEESTGEGDNEPGATRVLNLVNGKKLHETLKKYDAEKMMYSTKMPAATNDITALPVTNYSSSITVKGNGESSEVTYKGAFYRGYPNNDPPEDLNEEAAISAVKKWYTDSLENLKLIVESKL